MLLFRWPLSISHADCVMSTGLCWVSGDGGDAVLLPVEPQGAELLGRLDTSLAQASCAAMVWPWWYPLTSPLYFLCKA